MTVQALRAQAGVVEGKRGPDRRKRRLRIDQEKLKVLSPEARGALEMLERRGDTGHVEGTFDDDE